MLVPFSFMKTTFVSTPVATAATGVGETSFTANWNAFAGASYYLLDVSTSSSFSSFVGSYQNFVVISNSQVVSGLTANTTYYYRLRAATGVDADAASFFSRVYTAGGALSYTEVSATETLVADLKAYGIWTPMKAIYPMVGASAAACAQNLKSSSFTGTFTSGWTFASSGVTPNGTSAYMSTGFSINTEQASANNYTHGFYSGSIGGSSATKCSMGALTGSSESDILIRWAGGSFYANICEQLYNNAITNNDTHGFYVANRNTTNRTQSWKNGVKIVDIINVPTSKTTDFIIIGARNTNGTSSFFDDKRCQFAFMGDSLSDANQTNFYTAVQAFQTTLARQV